jgi:hypothetical protein
MHGMLPCSLIFVHQCIIRCPRRLYMSIFIWYSLIIWSTGRQFPVKWIRMVSTQIKDLQSRQVFTLLSEVFCMPWSRGCPYAIQLSTICLQSRIPVSLGFDRCVTQSAVLLILPLYMFAENIKSYTESAKMVVLHMLAETPRQFIINPRLRRFI